MDVQMTFGYHITFTFLSNFICYRCWVYVDMFAGSRDPCRWVSGKYAVVKYRSVFYIMSNNLFFMFLKSLSGLHIPPVLCPI